MDATSVYVQGADRMIITAQLVKGGLMVSFADGRQEFIAFSSLSIDSHSVERIDLPNAYELVLLA